VLAEGLCLNAYQIALTVSVFRDAGWLGEGGDVGRCRYWPLSLLWLGPKQLPPD